MAFDTLLRCRQTWRPQHPEFCALLEARAPARVARAHKTRESFVNSTGYIGAAGSAQVLRVRLVEDDQMRRLVVLGASRGSTTGPWAG